MIRQFVGVIRSHASLQNLVESPLMPQPLPFPRQEVRLYKVSDAGEEEFSQVELEPELSESSIVNFQSIKSSCLFTFIEIAMFEPIC